MGTPTPVEKQRAAKVLEERGYADPAGSMTLTVQQMMDWVAWAMAEGRTMEADSLRQAITERQKSSNTGGPAIICPTCQERVAKLNPHSMDRAKVELLEEIARKNMEGIQWVKIQRDGTLIKPEEQHSTIQRDDVHALRLKWFGLLEQYGPRTGKYRVSSLGLQFLRGLAQVSAKIWCRRGKVVLESPKKLWIWQVRGVVYDKAYWDQYAAVQTYSP